MRINRAGWHTEVHCEGRNSYGSSERGCGSFIEVEPSDLTVEKNWGYQPSTISGGPQFLAHIKCPVCGLRIDVVGATDNILRTRYEVLQAELGVTA